MQLKDSLTNLAPLSDEQQRQLNQALSTLNTQQLVWVSGYLYGLSQSGSQPVAATGAVTAPGGSLTILYGSQTGNAKGVASAIQAQAEVPQLQGAQHSWFCGAWTGYGFHEDGLKSGLAVADGLLAELRTPQAEAA